MGSKRSKAGHSKKKRGIAYYIFPLISLVIAIVCISYIISWYRENSANKEVMDNIYQDTIETNEETGEEKIDFAKLKAKNADIRGWLKVNNTNVDYPVVQSTDNSYYLTRNFNGESNLAGWVFADYRVKNDGTEKNYVIYGHNMKDGSMFGSLKKTLNSDWYNNQDNMIITYETEIGISSYKVFSVYEIPVETYYTNRTFSSDAEYQKFLDTLKSRSKKDFGVKLTPSDKILTLSTCASNSNNRYVVHAVKVD